MADLEASVPLAFKPTPRKLHVEDTDSVESGAKAEKEDVAVTAQDIEPEAASSIPVLANGPVDGAELVPAALTASSDKPSEEVKAQTQTAISPEKNTEANGVPNGTQSTPPKQSPSTTEDKEEAPTSISVKDLTKRLAALGSPAPMAKTASAHSLPAAEASTPGPSSNLLTAASAPPTPKEQAQASGRAASFSRKPAPVPSQLPKKGLPSPHDARNTINAAQLLKQKAFKFQPLKDWFPVEELAKLRLEDGIDPTCKEDYLEDSVFKEVFKMSREAFKAQPAWRQGNAKKKAGLF